MPIYSNIQRPEQARPESSKLYDAGEAHESHGQQTGCNQSDGGTLQALRHIDQAQLLANARKDGQRKTKAQCRRECINHTCQQVIVFLDNQDGNTQHTAVGRNQRKEHAQRLIERGRHFLQDDFYHLHQGGDES